MTAADLVQCRREGAVAVVTLDRPAKRNALNRALVNGLHGVFEGLAADPDLGAVVLQSSGKDFMAGADIAELKERGADEALEGINASLFDRIEACPAPVVAAVGGYALGGGCELALACDLRIAGVSAVFAQPEVLLGIIPGAGATYRLPRLVGIGRAKELIYTGRRVAAEEALAWGLVNAVVPDDRLRAEALAYAERIARRGRRAVRAAKSALDAGRRGVSARSPESLLQALLFESPEKHRRMKDFLESRRVGKKAADNRGTNPPDGTGDGR